MTLSDSPGPKIGGRWKQCAIIFYWGRVIPLWNLHWLLCKIFNF